MKKVLTIILCLVMILSVFTVVPFTVSAEDVEIAEVGATLYWPVYGHTGLSQDFWQHGGTAIDINDGNINGAEVRAAIGGTVTDLYLCPNNHLNPDVTWKYGVPYVTPDRYGSNGLPNPTCCLGNGHGMVIRGDDGRYYVYVHFQAGSIPTDKIYVGARVEAGQYIGKVGCTGNATGPHLHFQISTSSHWWETGFVNPQNESYNYGPSSNPIPDLGTGFYALITHMASWNHLTNESDGNVDICWENYTANQYWKFFRQSDGSYIIKNAATGKCLDVTNGSSQNGANIRVWDESGSNAQKWDIIPCGNGYQLKAKCTDCVMEMNAWGFYQGVNLVSGTRDGSSAEVFAINKRDFNEVGKTNLNASCLDRKVVFSWENARCATNYNIKIWKGASVLPGEAPINLWNAKNNPSTLNLEEGTYTAYIECYNVFLDYVNSGPVTFSIIDYSTLTPTSSLIYNDHRYELYKIKTTWKQAKEFCEQKGGHLAFVESAEENEVLTNLASGLSQYVWLGASDEAKESYWYWTNGNMFSFSNWYSGEPNNANDNEHYLQLIISGSAKGQWNDAANDSSAVSGFICEYELTAATILGDADGDGVVTVLDATTIQKVRASIAVKSYDETAADVDGDGVVSVIDATYIQKHLAHIAIPYEIGKTIG